MTDPENVWINRIVGYEVKPAAWFLANEANWRTHPPNQQEGLSGALSEVGWVQDVIVNKRTSQEWGDKQNKPVMVDGHLRVKLALKQGKNTPVPMKYVDLNPREEAIILATLDPITAMAEIDKEKLDALLRSAQSEDARVQLLLATLAEQQNLYDLLPMDKVDLSEFDQIRDGGFAFRVVVEDLTRQRAEEIAATIPGARVEQYRQSMKEQADNGQI